MIVITACVFFTLILFISYIYKDINNIYSTRFVFIFTWFFYTMTVPIDLTFGFNIKLFENTLDLNSNLDLVQQVMLLAYISLIGFMSGYFIIQMIPKSKKVLNCDNYKQKEQISKSTVYIINILAILVFTTLFLGINRQEIYALGNTILFYKLIFIYLLFIKGFNLFYIFNTKNNISFLLFFIILILPILQGARIELILYVLSYLLLKDIKFKFFTFITLLLIGILFMLLWKPLYSIIFYHADIAEVAAILFKYGISNIDFWPSFSITAQYIQNGDYGYLGATYYNVFYEIFPKIITNMTYTSLTSDFTEEYANIMYTKGGSLAFSFLAESWLNFGILGPYITSFTIGVIASIIDIRKKLDFILLVAIFFLLRMWRTEFSLLFKQVFILIETYAFWYLFFKGKDFVINHHYNQRNSIVIAKKRK